MPGQPDPERTPDSELPGKLLGEAETTQKRLKVIEQEVMLARVTHRTRPATMGNIVRI